MQSKRPRSKSTGRVRVQVLEVDWEWELGLEQDLVVDWAEVMAKEEAKEEDGE